MPDIVFVDLDSKEAEAADPAVCAGARKVAVLTYTAAGVEIGLPAAQAETKRAYDKRLRELLPPERAFLVAAP